MSCFDDRKTHPHRFGRFVPTSDAELEEIAYRNQKEEQMEKYQDWVEHLSALRGDVALTVQKENAKALVERRLEVTMMESFLRKLGEAHDSLVDLVGIVEERDKR
jgi:hypothetical protein